MIGNDFEYDRFFILGYLCGVWIFNNVVLFLFLFGFVIFILKIVRFRVFLLSFVELLGDWFLIVYLCIVLFVCSLNELVFSFLRGIVECMLEGGCLVFLWCMILDV